MAAAPATNPVAQPDLVAGVEPVSKKASFQLVEGANIAVTPSDTKNSVSRVQPDGVQVLTVLTKGDKARFHLENPSGTQLVDTGPGFDVMADGPEGPVLLASIAAPWAVDALGRQLATSYSLHGNTLVQQVETKGAVYPIVADPSITRKWYGWQVRFNHNETRIMAIGSAGVAAIAAVLPPPLNVYLAAVAGPAAVWAQWAQQYGNCIAVNFTYVGSWHSWYWNC